MTQTTLINDIYGVVGSQGEITDLNVDGKNMGLVRTVMGPGGGVVLIGPDGKELSGVGSVVQYMLAKADIAARPPRLVPVDSVDARLFCALGDIAYGHGLSNRRVCTLDTKTMVQTDGYEFPGGTSILDMYPGASAVFATVFTTATDRTDLWRITNNGLDATLVHRIGTPPGLTTTQSPHRRILMRGFDAGLINGAPALVFATYTGGESTPGTEGTALYIAASYDDGLTWVTINHWNWDFATSVENTTIRHFHAAKYDKWRDCWWFAAGDTDAESSVIKWDGRTPGPGNISPALLSTGAYPGWECRSGTQRWRAVDILVTEDWIETFTDTTGDEHGGIWRMRPDFTQSHRVNHSVQGYGHDGWASLIAPDGTHLWCDSPRGDALQTTQKFTAIYASRSGERYFEVGRVAVSGEINISKLPRGFFVANGLVWFSTSGEAGKEVFSTTGFKMKGKFIDELPDNYGPVYYVDPVGGNDGATGYTRASAWKTMRNATGTGKVTHGARIMLLGSSAEGQVSSIDYTSNAKPALDVSARVQFSGMGRETVLTLTSSGWRGTAAQAWDIEFTDMTMRVADAASMVLHDNSTRTGGAQIWRLRDATVGDAVVGANRLIYPRNSKLIARRTRFVNIVDTTKSSVSLAGSSEADLRSCIFEGGRIIVEFDGKLTMQHVTMSKYAAAGVSLQANSTVAPSVKNCAFLSTSTGVPVANYSATITTTPEMFVDNYYGRPAAAISWPTKLQNGGPTATDLESFVPFEWSPLVGLAQPAGVNWDYYGNPFRARPAIGACEVP